MTKLISDRFSLLIVLFSVLLYGCAGSIGKQVSTGVVKGVTAPDTQAALTALTDSLARSVVKGVIGGVSDEQQRLDALTDSLARSVVRGVVGGVADPETQAALAVLNDSLAVVLSRQVSALRESILGEPTQRDLVRLTERLGMALNQQVFALRDSLLAPSTAEGIASIVDSLIVSVARRYQNDIRPVILANLEEDAERLDARVNEQVATLRATVIRILVVAGIFLAFVLGIISYFIRKIFKQKGSTST